MPAVFKGTDCVMAPLLHNQEAEGLDVRVTDPPGQNTIGTPVIVGIAGKAFTVTPAVTMVVQPFAVTV